ncbi:MAG: hypothetical protein ACOC6F_03530 [bacterium]
MQIGIDGLVVRCLRWIAFHAGPVGVLLVLGVIALWYLEDIWERLRFIVGVFYGASDARNRASLRSRMQGDINASVLRLQKEVPELFDETVKVGWIEEGIDHANVRPGSIFVRVRTGADEDRIFLNVVRCFLDRSLLLEARRYVHGHVMRATQLVLTARFLQRSTFRSAQAVFRTEQYDPVLAEDTSMIEPVNTLELLDHQGLFTRVFLRECSSLRSLLGHSHETTGPKWDVLGFLNYLDSLFRGLQEDRVVGDFEYSSNTLQVAFAVLADPSRMRTSGLRFYKRRTKRSIMNGARTVYIIALGEHNGRLAAELAQWLDSQGLVRDYRFSRYTVKRRGDSLLAVCGVCFVPPSIELHEKRQEVDMPLVDDDNLQQILETTIPEIRLGEVDVVKTALLEGDQALVVVHSRDSSRSAVGPCVGHGGSRARAVKTAAEMYVRFVSWSSDVKDFVAECLGIADEEKLTAVEVEPALRTATVYVSSDRLLDNLREDESTLKLAEAITEHDILVRLDQRAFIASTAAKVVPDIANGRIVIEKIAHVPRIITRILVSSPAVYDPASACGLYAREIAAKAGIAEPGRVFFSEKHDELRDTVVSALYPLRNEDVIEVDVTGNDGVRVLVSNEEAMARAVGKGGAHVKSASELVDCWISIDVQQGA